MMEYDTGKGGDMVTQPEHIGRSLDTVEVATLRFEVERLRKEVTELAKLREEVAALRNAIRLTNGSMAHAGDES